VAPQVSGFAVRAYDHRHRVPAQDRADLPLERHVAVAVRFALHGNRVDVCGRRLERNVAAGATGFVDHAFEQVMRALGAIGTDDGGQRLDPLPRFDRIDVLIEHVLQLIHECPPHAVTSQRALRPMNGAL
jgi:hypothetical protein